MNEWRTAGRRRVPSPAGEAVDALQESDDDLARVDDAEYGHYVATRALKLMQAEFQPTTWRACWLQVVDGYTAAEAAAEVGITEAAAYVAKSRVLRRLRQDVEGFLS